MLFIFMLGLSIVLSFSVVQCLLSQLHSTGTDNYPFAPHLASYTKFQCLWDIAFKCPAILTSGFIFFLFHVKITWNEMKYNFWSCSFPRKVWFRRDISNGLSCFWILFWCNTELGYSESFRVSSLCMVNRQDICHHCPQLFSLYLWKQILYLQDNCYLEGYF